MAKSTCPIRMDPRTKDCPNCGKAFARKDYPRISEAQWVRRVYCGWHCAQAGRIRKGSCYHANGYRLIRITAADPFWGMRSRTSSATTGYVWEHRLVVARLIGRALGPEETVHHKNGVRDDNRPANLQLRRKAHGAGVSCVCLDCGSQNIEFQEL